MKYLATYDYGVLCLNIIGDFECYNSNTGLIDLRKLGYTYTPIFDQSSDIFFQTRGGAECYKHPYINFKNPKAVYHASHYRWFWDVRDSKSWPEALEEPTIPF